MLLRVYDLHAAYGDIKVLKGVELDISEGEIVCLLGANGAGKSTLMRVISGILRPLRGRITYQKREIARLRPNDIVRLGISQVPEGRQIFAKLTVMQNLLLGAYTRKNRRADSREMFDLTFQLFPVLQERLKQKAGTLSGGEQQMLAISRALMSRPQLLLLDEPSLGLAPIVVKNIFEVVKRLRSQGISILLVEQNVTGALSISDRCYIMETGNITAQGKASEMLGNDQVRRKYFGK
ncbi:MAG: ABC transporter ATP-binding protein [Desulfobacterales bacterium]|nr:ABC transporter ATP-binding protein [Desulfobacterales bacterium]